MSEEKKTYNGRVQFWEHGYVGVKDYDDNVVISPSLQYEEIREREGEEVAIVLKGGKWALTNLDGVAICPFIYDRISYIGAHLYKAGIYVSEDYLNTRVEYADTRMTYAILDANGNILCDRNKGYNYISEVHEGEATAAINGRCGIIDLHGNVLMDFQHKYIQPMGEGHYLVSYHNEDDNYYATIINRKGDILISSSMQYRSIYAFHNNVAVAHQNGKWGLIDDNGNHIGEFNYSFVEEWGEGYYKAEQGAQKNILRPDGSVVLEQWYNDVFKVQHGFFIFGNTIRKSKTNPKTRYIQGVAHVSGIIVFPMIFERTQWCEDGLGIYAEIDEKPYILTLDGSIYDPAHSHLPLRKKINWPDLFEKFANWTLPGLQFYYRDTDARVIIETTYHVGDVLRAGFLLDATTQLWKPAHRTRFIIASAHAAHFFEIEDLVKANPNVKEWNLCTFPFNSYFKVMDVYEKDGYRQVFLLHIPPAAALFLGRDETAINFINEATGQEGSLIEMARKSLDGKLKMDIHPRSLDQDFVNRMHHPIGLDPDFWPVSPYPMEEPVDGELAFICNIVHKLSDDKDIKDFIVEEDNFPFTGIVGRVCEDCIYAKGICGNGEGCGRLFINSFRNRYLKGNCEYHKTDLYEPSRYEELESFRKKKEKETKEKTADTFAVGLLNDFIKEKLDGNIDNLRTYDLSKLRDDSKYGDCSIERAPIVRAIMALAFADTWPNLSVNAIEKYEYWCSPINHYQRLFGANILDQYFKGLQNFSPTVEQHERALNVAHLIYSIGNMWVLPNKASFSSYLDDSKYKGYVDKFLKSMYDVFVGVSKVDLNMKGIPFKNRKMMTEYEGLNGWRKFIKMMMLEDYTNGAMEPKPIFNQVWCSMKGITREDYFEAFDKYCSFCEEAIPKRSEQIIEKLKEILN